MSRSKHTHKVHDLKTRPINLTPVCPKFKLASNSVHWAREYCESTGEHEQSVNAVAFIIIVGLSGAKHEANRDHGPPLFSLRVRVYPDDGRSSQEEGDGR